MARALASIVFCVAILFGANAPVSAQTPDETVKAAFLYRFASFVTWPSTAFQDEQAPVRLCVLGASSFAETLSAVTRGQHVADRGFEVRNIASLEEARSCHIVYAVGERADDALRLMHGLPVLTITDGAVGSGGARGIIHFVIVDNKVRFYIDDALAAADGLSMSSRLLSVAVSVRRRTPS